MRVAALAGKDPWRDRCAPRPLSFDAALVPETASASAAAATAASGGAQSLADAARQFVACAERLAAREVRGSAMRRRSAARACVG